MALNEVAPGTCRISTHLPWIDLQFDQSLVADDEPLLYHAGMRGLSPRVLGEVEPEDWG